jgi:LAGLIDADG DNA endonuclease family
VKATKQELEDLYVTEGLSPKKIAILFNVSPAAIYKRIDAFGIPRINRVCARYKAMVDLFTADLGDIIIGSLLGDGHIEVSNKSARYEESHSIKQKEYVDWKLEAFGKLVSYKHFGTARLGDKSFGTYSFKSLSHPNFLLFHALFYAEKKIIRPSLIDHLTPKVLAVWVMDDGSLHKSNNRIRISTDCFVYEHQLSLRGMLKSKFDIVPNIFTDHRTGNHYLEFNSKESKKLSGIIAPYYRQHET